jgi:ATP-dependent Clp protease ATP-binding subunit ClpX
LIAQYRKLARFHGADLIFTDEAIREVATIALARGTGARGLRSVIEEVLEGVLFRGGGGNAAKLGTLSQKLNLR